MRQLARVVAGTVVLISATAGGATAVVAVPAPRAEAPVAAWCTPGAEVAAATLPERLAEGACDRGDVTVADGAARVPLPRPGQTVSASVLSTSGARTLTVARDDAGALVVRRGAGTAAPAGAADGTARTACGSSSFVDLGYQVGGTYDWRYNGRNAPANVAGAALAALKTATNNITNGNDDCGIAGKPRTSNAYRGTTTAAPGITADARCGSSPDQVNITGWKSLTASGVLAVTCTYSFTGSGDVADSDAAINTRYRWTTTPAGCRGAYDLTGVMTHERGHTFGLGHPSATTANRGLTMYPSVAACDFSIRTLGKGDLLGLFRIYGKA